MINYIIAVIGLVCGAILIIGANKINKPHDQAWSRIALRLAGFCMMLWASLKIVQIAHIITYSTEVGIILQTAKIFIGGMFSGILMLVVIAGGSKKKSKDDTVSR